MAFRGLCRFAWGAAAAVSLTVGQAAARELAQATPPAANSAGSTGPTTGASSTGGALALPDRAAGGTASTGAADRGGSATRVTASLALVLGAFLLVAWLQRGRGGRGERTLPEAALESLGRTVVGPRQTLQLLRVGERLLLVAWTPSGASALAEITHPDEVDQLIDLCQSGRRYGAARR